VSLVWDVVGRGGAGGRQWPGGRGRRRRQHTLLLDKTGTIPLGNRQAVELIAVGGIEEKELADAAKLASLADETPEGRSVVVLAKSDYGLRERSDLPARTSCRSPRRPA
jgi:high-affinity K+ transport system ATPase subunit B